MDNQTKLRIGGLLVLTKKAASTKPTCAVCTTAAASTKKTR